MKFPIALQLYSVRDLLEKDLEGGLKQVKELGYDGVELAGLYGLLPAVLLITGAAHVMYLCVLCSGISFLLLTGLLIFKGKEMFSELYKKLHF